MNEEMVIKITEHDKEIGSLKHRMTSCERQQEQIAQLVRNTDRLASSIETMTKELERQGKRLEALEKAPSDEFKHYKRVIIGCILTGSVGIIIGSLMSLIIK